MAFQSRDDLTYLEIYRPVIAMSGQFMEKAGDHLLQVFGTELSTTNTNPSFEEDSEGQLTPVMSVIGIERPRIDVYPQPKLHLLDRRVEPRLNYASRFRWVGSRLIRNPDDSGYRPIARDIDEQKARVDQKRRTSLAYIFEQIGLEYGITDQDEVQISCHAIDIPVDPPLEHLGLELSLLPNPVQHATRMLVRHAGVCLRGLGRHSPKAANPQSPTALRIPFVRLPVDATRRQEDRFIEAIQSELPVRVALGPFEDGIHAPSWSRTKR